MEISKSTRKKLKKPLGRLCNDFSRIKRLSKDCKIISVGDMCTLALLQIGIRPHLAVFDFRCKREDISENHKTILKRAFPGMQRMKNPKGTISKKILEEAHGLISKGGAILVEGEEDLTALAFIKEAEKDDVVVYGQPGEGVVVVEINKEIKEKARRLLSSALAGKVERDKSGKC